ncbi:glutathione S-transferase [Endobacter medicaginis]|jgi:glutathione S-transferase|uniref:Glutathione S-transferase n=1 Tax=Endobacter medicaginis TaxID=1181271 RepID=A0A850NYS9_9PROT|nr:glutathione S-transferase [Endobacter medicaginis]MBB3173849.1 glutathione S-transferase [Endobacter medicaginis]MCX5476131.1 glutathione S-transferase [Endobacter medicaginis]NVN31037.1 glutathione S-transferase [Endobacter medicaginis]
MQLIGMLDSPYVRRVAVSLHVLGLPFEHRPLSVFRDYDAFAALNPTVKAPTLITDDGVAIAESGLILAYATRLAQTRGMAVTLDPLDLPAYARAQRLVGLSLAVCEKAVQLVYEANLRPAEKRHAPWVERVQGQLHGGLREIEADLDTWAATRDWLFGPAPMQADLSLAVAWRFARERLPDLVSVADHPALADLSRRAEATAAFIAYPFA